MAIPMNVEAKLSDELWKRKNDAGLDDAFAELGIESESEFAEFYRRYWGPFHSATLGYELLDVVEQDESVRSSTQAVREEFGFEDRFVVVSTLTGMSVLVYDVKTGSIYDVDFEGGDELLRTGELEPRWNSWNEFISIYFS
jgi:hypothetical protein